MSFVSDLTPTNLLEEREKFFQDFSYNPQFEYVREFSEEELYMYGHPGEAYFESIKDLLLHQPFQPYIATITEEKQVTQRVEQMLSSLNIDYPLEINFSPELLPRCSITKERIVFRTPIEFSEEDFQGLMNHEIQTHLLRRLNNYKQPWHGQKIERSVKVQREFTEEGMANLHSFVEQTDKGMRRSWINYAAIYLGERLSFAETFAELRKLGVDEGKAWFATTRTKRGVKDTGQPGGNTKGLVYLLGAVKVWEWVLNSENDPYDLYMGRVSLSEVEEKAKIATRDGLIYPTFMKDSDRYRSLIREIGEVNQLSLLQ
jgi:hypothetical protein